MKRQVGELVGSEWRRHVSTVGCVDVGQVGEEDLVTKRFFCRRRIVGFVEIIFEGQPQRVSLIRKLGAGESPP